MAENENRIRNYSTDFLETSAIPNLPPGVYRYPIYRKSWTEWNPIDRRSLLNNAVDQSLHLPASTNMSYNSNFDYMHHPNSDRIINQYDPDSQDLKPSSNPHFMKSPKFTEQYLRELDAERVRLLPQKTIQTDEIITDDTPPIDLVKDVQNLGTVRVDPDVYMANYGSELVTSEYILDMMARLGLDHYYTEMQTEQHSSLMNPNQYEIVDSSKKLSESHRYPMADEVDFNDSDSADEEVRQLTANGIKRTEFLSNKKFSQQN